MSGFVVLEGIDGCGKSSVAKAVVRAKPKAVLTSEPTDSWMGRAVKRGEGKEISPYTDALLFMADRAQHTDEIAGMLRRGKLVICDRYYHSTVAYQTASLKLKGLGDNFGWLLEANTRISLKPDITFLFVIDPDTALARIGNRSKLSRFERLDFLKEVQRNYLRLARRDRSIVRIDASASLPLVVEKVLGVLKERNL
jgi:dTMP kinase